MWYVVQTTNGQEDTAIEKCRQAIPVEVADKIFSPSYEGHRKYRENGILRSINFSPVMYLFKAKTQIR